MSNKRAPQNRIKTYLISRSQLRLSNFRVCIQPSSAVVIVWSSTCCLRRLLVGCCNLTTTFKLQDACDRKTNNGSLQLTCSSGPPKHGCCTSTKWSKIGPPVPCCPWVYMRICILLPMGKAFQKRTSVNHSFGNFDPKNAASRCNIIPFSPFVLLVIHWTKILFIMK